MGAELWAAGLGADAYYPAPPHAGPGSASYYTLVKTISVTQYVAGSDQNSQAGGLQ